ncbi:biotin holocarboxylase synthetase-like protein [Phanerochaete sordida]|uniref:Biotin holocarboxylase synthetase-like protein n=1 Tax=Phanerochaete sordida TaxID=48140 RepID=A0A9P3G267_9APHY|nr:biotin holocarboxylase synthetase-like protein [Phanerochaete sordida]
MNVLVYTGPETLPSSVSRSLTALRSALYPNYTVQPVTSQSLATAPWTASCALLVVPACRDPLALTPAVQASVRAFVEGGGAFLGLRAAATCATGIVAPGDYAVRFHSRAGPTVYCTFIPGEEQTKTADLVAEDGTTLRGVAAGAAPDFEGIERCQSARVVARDAEGAVAAVEVEVGSGKVALWGVQLEVPIVAEDGASAVREAEEQRRAVLNRALASLGLQLPTLSDSQPTHPLPQFLVGAPSRPEVVPSILQSLELRPPATLKDANDTFAFHDATDAETLLQQSRAAPPADETRHVVAYENGALPPTVFTPLFNVQQFFEDLKVAREKAGLQTSQPWGVGEALFYGEAVTSTQTMLDKNYRFLSSLPSPIVSLATHQIAGRGRGGNSWVSPLGCLQFSLRLRASLIQLPLQKLVFVQYLVALAVVQGARDTGVLGEWGDRVRVKWPNDVYIVGDGGEQKPVKVSGNLVYTTSDGEHVDIVIGCGVNVLNPPPIPSLASILPPGAERPTMERTAAIILTKFELLWNTFVSGRGSFEPFMDSYLDNWLHSDQVVTLTTTTPHQRVRIVGITSDYGLLRTIPESGASHNFIDLQPDGNSFDLMSGMIMTKAK